MKRLFALSYLKELKIFQHVTTEREAVQIIILSHRRLRARNEHRLAEKKKMGRVRRFVAHLFNLGPP